jgi:ABC-type amino acid transport substrate-binding protein
MSVTPAGAAAVCPVVKATSFVEPGVLQVSVTATAPPLDTIDAANSPVGMYIDFVNLMAKDLKISKVRFVRLEFAGMLPGLKAGRFDMGGAGVNQTPERLASQDFTLSTPYIASGTTLMVRKESPIQSWDDMRDKTLGGGRGEAQTAAARERAQPRNVIEFPGRPEGVLALANGQVDAYALDAAEGAYFIKTAPNGSMFRLLPEVISVVAKGTVFRRENRTLIDSANCVILKYLGAGVFDELTRKWYGTTGPVDTLRKMRPELFGR